MKLRIISGFLGGRYISIPSAAGRFRATLEKNRRAIADFLGKKIENAIVGDFCSGSGSFGFEMISRGSLCVDFVEADRVSAEFILKNARNLEIENLCTIFAMDIRSYIRRCTKQYDIIFFDPPYDNKSLAALVPVLTNLLTKTGILVHEHRKFTNIRSYECYSMCKCFESRRYGDTIFDFYSTNCNNF